MKKLIIACAGLATLAVVALPATRVVASEGPGVVIKADYRVYDRDDWRSRRRHFFFRHYDRDDWRHRHYDRY